MGIGLRVIIPESWLERPSLEEDLVDIVEVGEIGIDLDDPVGPAKHDGHDVDARDTAGEEGAVFHPCYHVVQGPGDVEPDCGYGEVPAVAGLWEEYEGAVAHGED